MVANMKITPVTEEMQNAEIERENELEAANGGQEDQLDAGQNVGDQGDDRGGEAELEPVREKPIQMTPQDQKRMEMANRFKRPGLESAPFDGDLTRDENIYGSVAAEQLEVDPDAPEPGVPHKPTTFKENVGAEDDRVHVIKVRGKEVRLTTAELLERASKVEAADSYLDESRDILEKAKQVRDGRTAPDGQHPDHQNRANEDGLDTDRQDTTRRPGPDLKSVVEKIQFGDPEEAARELGEVINSTASKMANEGHVQRLVSNDLARSKADLKAFTDANAELAKDPIASAAIENMVYGIYRDEIRALGVDEAQIPKDPKALADWHRLYRVHGHTVSKPADVLQKAKGQFDAWRGPSQQQQKPANERKGNARVEVNVDRTERRMAIPLQPSRAVAPRRDTASAPPTQETSRKSAVQEMRRQRGQPVA